MANLEQRQLEKIQPLQIPSHVHEINKKTGRTRSCAICKLAKKQMKHEREKEYVGAAAGIAKEIIRGTGEGLRGLLQNQIAGTAFFILAAYALYPEWVPVVTYATSKIGGDLAKAIHDDILPNVPTLFNGGKIGVTPTPAPPTNNDPKTDLPTTPQPKEIIRYYLWKWSIFGWNIHEYTDLGQATSDFDHLNVAGVCGNLWEADVSYTAEGPIWHPTSNLTVIKRSTIHPDVGPQAPK